MGKTVIKILAIVFLWSAYNCSGTKTPNEFLFHPEVTHTIYKEDSLYLSNLLFKLIDKNIRPFNSRKLYDDHSIMSIDTIYYSPGVDKFVVFIIVKKSMSKFDRYITDITKYKYEGFFFFGYRSSDQEIILNKNCVYTFSSDEREGLKESMRSYALIRKATDHPFAGQPQYNMNDIRLWTSKQMDFEMNDSTNLIKLVDEEIQFLKSSK